MISDLDYGFEPAAGLMMLSEAVSPLGESPVQVNVASNRSWQSSGLRVNAGQNIEIRAAGSWLLGNQPSPWLSYADGVTLEYHRGQPLGRLMMCVAAPLERELPTEPLTVYPIGESATMQGKISGEVFFRINESTAELKDNSGQLTVTLRSVSREQ